MMTDAEIVRLFNAGVSIKELTLRVKSNSQDTKPEAKARVERAIYEASLPKRKEQNQ